MTEAASQRGRPGENGEVVDKDMDDLHLQSSDALDSSK